MIASRPSNMLEYLRGRICSDECTCCHTEIKVARHTRRRRRRKRRRSLFACWLLRPNNMPVYLRGRFCSDDCMFRHTEIEVADKTSSPSHSVLTPGPPVPALTLEGQAPGRVAIGVQIFKSLV